MYPTGASSPKFYGLPKIHKKNMPLRPIVSSIGSVTYGVAKELARVIKPLMGNSEHHVNNTKQFAYEMRKTKLEEGECITSYDVTAWDWGKLWPDSPTYARFPNLLYTAELLCIKQNKNKVLPPYVNSPCKKVADTGNSTSSFSI